jgi:hypothetical protein
VQDLIKAYEFAETHTLTFQNMLKAHCILAKTVLVDEKYQGKLRDKEVGVYAEGKKIYRATPLEILEIEMNKLFEDIDFLATQRLTNDEIFYYAAQLPTLSAAVAESVLIALYTNHKNNS